MKQKVIISVINDLSGDQRIHRIASTLAEAGYEVLVVGRKLPNSIPLSDRTYQTHRMRLFFIRGKWFYLEFNFRLFWFLLFRKADILNANDLDTLLANFLISRIKGTRLIYDSHEYFTEVPELIARPFTRNIWLRLEQWIFPRLNQIYTVNHSLASIYSQKYQKEVQVIRNVPFYKTGIKKEKKGKILIYQGALNVGRGIELMIRAMDYMPDITLWIIGRGDIEEALRKRAESQKSSQQIIFKGFIPLESLFEQTTEAYLGLSIEENLGDNYRFASPNKVYDYIQAGLPVLVSDLPEMRGLVEKYKVGEVLAETEREPEKFAARIKEILNNEEKYAHYQTHCLAAKEELNWEKEREKLISIYQNQKEL
ncbi:MAG: glycosyltransferase [Bacteroidetes bacterium]|nr:glycosyltransferase [Bacteroidota bacterium]